MVDENENFSSSSDSSESTDNDNTSNIEEVENKPNVRRLSLFDTLNETTDKSINSTSEDNSLKTEPILDSEDSSMDELHENITSEEFESEEELPDEEFNQEKEEELLDIPTFLRRQAN